MPADSTPPPGVTRVPARSAGKWRSIVLPLLLFAGALVGIGVPIYGAAKRTVIQTVASDMEAIARLKVDQVRLWLAERHDDARVAIDADRVLFPQLQKWPGASPSGEILLLRREGDQVVYLNAVGQDGNPVSNLHHSLSGAAFLSAQLVGKGEGFLAGDDYRGAASLAYGLPVPGTDWFLVAKVSRDEALQQLNAAAALSSALVAALVMLCAWWLVVRRRTEEALRRSVEEVQAEIAERLRTETCLAQMTRLYAVLSKANQAIVRVPERNRLLQEICRIAVEHGAFVMAWAGQVEAGQVVPVAKWGKEDGYLDKVSIIIRDRQLGSGPTGRAIREGQRFVCSDIATDSRMGPWRDLALERGYRSSAAIPIREDGAVVGSVSLYAAEPGFFTPEVVSLLDDLSADITFALDAHLQATRRRAAEDELRLLNEQLERRVADRTRELEMANRELETFSYSVSHDLRAPLRSIDGFSQILLKRSADSLDEAGRDYLGRIRRASQRMGELIDDLLNLSRVTRTALRLQSVDFTALARALLDDLERNSPERRVRFIVQEGLRAFGDLGLLCIVLENLLGNAWKFTAKRDGAEIEFGCREENDRQVYFVRDNGAGFDNNYAGKLFQVFQRLHGEDEFEGTGIGLATVRRVILRHHGEVWAEGEAGKGATFYFTLPRRDKEVADNKGEEEMEPREREPTP